MYAVLLHIFLLDICIPFGIYYCMPIAENRMTIDNRKNILECAVRLFATHGYDAVGIQEIVAAAGITKPTLYHYFGNKQGLLEALLHEHTRQLLADLRFATDYRGDLTLSLTNIVKVYFRFAQQHRAFYRMQLAMWFAPPDNVSFQIVAELNQEQHQLIEGLFIQATEQHGNMRGRHRRYAATFLGTINTYVTLALNDYAELNDALIHTLVHQFMYGILS